VHQIIARTALFVSEHGGQSEIVLRVKQGDNPTFGFLMPDHHLHSYFRYLVDHPQLLKDGADAVGTNKGNTENEHASSGGALSLLGTTYDSGDENEGTLPRSSEGMNPENSMTLDVQGHVKSASIMPDKKEIGKNQNAPPAVKRKTILMKKNQILTGNSMVAVQHEKVNDAIIASSTSKSHTNSGLSEIKEMILEPPSFMKRTMEKIIEFILTNGKEFEKKLIEQDRTTGRFPFLLSSNPYHSYYLKFLQETEESNSHGRSPNNKDRRGSSDRRGRNSRERADRSSCERADRSSRERADRRCSMERKDINYSMESSASDRSSSGPSEKQLYDKQGKGIFHPVCGVKTRKVTADEAAAIVMAATRGLGAANDSLNTMKGTKDNVRTHVSNDPSSSFGSFSSLQDRNALSKHISNSDVDASLTSSGQPQREGFGIIDDDWIANTIAKAAAAAASKEAGSLEATMTKEQKLKADRLRRAKMFAAIIKSGDNKMNDLAAASNPTSEAAKAIPDMNASGLDLQSVAKEREGSSSVLFDHEGPNLTKHSKDSDDEQNRVRKYRKKHQESDEEKDESEDSYKHSRKKHRPEHSRDQSKDVHKHKNKSHSKDRESRHHRHHCSSSEDEHEHERWSSKSRHRHRDDHRYSDEEHSDEEHRRSHKHRREHHSSSKRKHEED